ncbi:regulatory protein RecX [Naumannella halotolerans]|uniref:regulatory protein RecX n=1 Tax=Naumannella halotolerans TaxID=993414 RepID=UPI00106071A6|nr:regulatory protein RecX [Naumannella halotolerans]
MNDADSSADAVDQVRQWLAQRGKLPADATAPTDQSRTADQARPVASARPADAAAPGGSMAHPGEPAAVDQQASSAGAGDRSSQGSGAAGTHQPGRRPRRGRRTQKRVSAEETGPLFSSDSEAEEEARTIVLRQLTGQARTRAELEKKLADKEIPADTAKQVLDRFTDVGLINDSEFARSWVESRQQRRNLSRTALRQELRRKGVDPEIIGDAVGIVETDDEYVAALDLAQRKVRTMGGLVPETRKRRLVGALARRGFSSSIVYRVLDEVLDAEPE